MMLILDKLAENHEPMAPIGYGIVAIVIFLGMLAAVYSIGRGRPDRR